MTYQIIGEEPIGNGKIKLGVLGDYIPEHKIDSILDNLDKKGAIYICYILDSEGTRSGVYKEKKGVCYYV